MKNKIETRLKKENGAVNTKSNNEADLVDIFGVVINNIINNINRQ